MAFLELTLTTGDEMRFLIINGEHSLAEKRKLLLETANCCYERESCVVVTKFRLQTQREVIELGVRAIERNL